MCDNHNISSGLKIGVEESLHPLIPFPQFHDFFYFKHKYVLLKYSFYLQLPVSIPYEYKGTKKLRFIYYVTYDLTEIVSQNCFLQW